MKRQHILFPILLICFLITSCEKEVVEGDIYGVWKGSATVEQVRTSSPGYYKADYLVIDFHENGSAYATFDEDSVFFYWNLINEKIYLIDTSYAQNQLAFGGNDGVIRLEVIENTPTRQFWTQTIKNSSLQEYTEWDLER